MSNWFTAPYSTSAAQPLGWGAYAEDPSGVKAATYSASWASFLTSASPVVKGSNPGVAVSGSGSLVGAWAFQCGWTWCALA